MSVVTDQSFVRFLAVSHRTDVEAWRAEVARKSARNRYFLSLDEAAKSASPHACGVVAAVRAAGGELPWLWCRYPPGHGAGCGRVPGPDATEGAWHVWAVLQPVSPH